LKSSPGFLGFHQKYRWCYETKKPWFKGIYSFVGLEYYLVNYSCMLHKPYS
jgi:hypothetical protein